MIRRAGPRAGTAAHRVLCRLVELGGRATGKRLKEILSREYQAQGKFQTKVTDVLLMFGLATHERGDFAATKAGKDFVAGYMGVEIAERAKYVGQVAGPRVTRLDRDLNLNRVMLVAPVRPGAFDYREYPSLMGVTRKLMNGEVVG